MDIVSLDVVPIEEIVDAFNDAFSSYQVPMVITRHRLENMMAMRGIRLDHSFGYVDGARLNAFVLNGSRRIGSELAAYDSGTGVRQSVQGQGLGTSLLKSVLARLTAKGYRRYILEVLTENRAAHSMYRKLGFRETREFNCYTIGTARWNGHEPSRTGHLRVVSAECHSRIRELRDYRPSWQNADVAVLAMGERGACVEYTDGESEGYAIVIPATGNVVQLGWRGPDSVVERLLGAVAQRCAAAELRILNIETTADRTNRALMATGCTVFAAQFEMAISLR